ncbi:MAG TPA: SDR family NAD(P)-dependent oxidoreductase [Microlunatus sp.]|nr:SDR family NAD(P)-dependent oxidoreductase [Microlunatus sp.]
MTSSSSATARRVLVTGGNRGIGFGLVAGLLARGDRVVLTARDHQRGEDARRRLLADHPGAEIGLEFVDVSSPESIDELAERLLADGRPIDGLINNAGILLAPPERTLTPEGVELTLATNTLGPMLLTERLMPLLAPAARVLCMTSRLHRPESRGDAVRFDPDDPNLDRGYSPDRAYKNSKLALIWVAEELDRRVPEGVTCNAVCPGFVPRTAAPYTKGLLKFELRFILPRLPFTVSVEQAAEDVLWALDDASLAGRGGLYLTDRAVAEPSADARDLDQADRFWTLGHALWGRPAPE